MFRRSLLLLSSLALAACAQADSSDTADTAEAPALVAASLEIGAGVPFQDIPEEVRLRNVRQLTFDGENAEAYFSFDGTQLIFQRTEQADGACDVIWRMDLASGDTTLASTGTGRTTCSYFFPDDQKIIYASTHHVSEQCPAPPDMSRGYVWALYPSYDLFVSNADGTDLVQLTDTPGYDAEATISPTGDRIVFTSVRNGDLDLYSMNLDGSDLVQLTDRIGYDGGAFYSPDGSKIVWRAHYPDDPEEIADYQSLLGQGLIRPSALEVWVMDADGSNQRQVTNNGAANFGPFWHPDGERIIWSSNQGDPSGREFDLFMIHEDGTGEERITHTGDFDGFPMFSPDGRYLVWGSNRNPSHQANTNVFIAEWVEDPGS
ncbi:MAG: PD40 domain-containing protein [Gemmatimonadales bacterium]|jgi:Tol biopolymer transport system component|nr:MAG: PD40 domain-containing protein [Gemmatimonadales bacterium]